MTVGGKPIGVQSDNLIFSNRYIVAQGRLPGKRKLARASNPSVDGRTKVKTRSGQKPAWICPQEIALLESLRVAAPHLLCGKFNIQNQPVMD